MVNYQTITLTIYTPSYTVLYQTRPDQTREELAEVIISPHITSRDLDDTTPVSGDITRVEEASVNIARMEDLFGPARIASSSLITSMDLEDSSSVSADLSSPDLADIANEEEASENIARLEVLFSSMDLARIATSPPHTSLDLEDSADDLLITADDLLTTAIIHNEPHIIK